MKPTRLKIKLTKGRYFILDSYLSLFVWIIIVLSFPVFSIFKEYLLPRYYFFDANTINLFMKRGSPLTHGDSYASTAAFYNFLHVSKDSIVFPVIASLIIIAVFFWVLKKAKATNMTVLDFAMYLYCILLAIVYMTLLSKDFIVFLFVIPFISLAQRGVKGLLLWSVLALLYAYYFRGYWIIVLCLFWGLYIFFPVLKKNWVLFLFIFISLFVLSIAFKVGMGIDLDNYRNMVNDVRLDSGDTNARSMIVSYIPGGGLIIGWLNAYVVWLFMMIPIPLVLALSPLYLIISFFITMLFYKFWGAAKVELIKNQNPVLKAVICLIISFTAVQSIFEPDYGSYVRHLSPFYPLFFYVLFITRKDSYSKN